MYILCYNYDSSIVGSLFKSSLHPNSTLFCHVHATSWDYRKLLKLSETFDINKITSIAIRPSRDKDKPLYIVTKFHHQFF